MARTMTVDVGDELREFIDPFPFLVSIYSTGTMDVYKPEPTLK